MTIDVPSKLSPELKAALKQELSRRASYAARQGWKHMPKAQRVARTTKASHAGREARAKCKHQGTDRYVLRLRDGAKKKIIITKTTTAKRGERQYCRFCSRILKE